MIRSQRSLFLVIIAFGLALLASCGSSTETSVASATAVDDTAGDDTAGEEPAAASDEADEDHGDEDHGDEDHGDEDHSDEDHSDEDHSDEDHDDHADEKDHDDHGDEDHDDHDDHDHDDHVDTSGGFDAHVHGAAELFVAWSGGEVVVDFVSPAFNIYGFEREPETDEERAMIDALAGTDVLVLNADAACTLIDEIEPVLEIDGSHAEVEASWIYTCENPDAITELDASGLFSAYPRLEDLDAQWASDVGQSASELSPSSTVLQLG